jgi:hypothetical protein
MEWWIIIGLSVVVLILIAIYRRSLRENRAVVHYALILLLSDDIYKIQRSKLAQYVTTRCEECT